MPELSTTLDRFRSSEISDMFSLAQRLKEQGRQLVDFSIGETDFDTPDHIKQAGIEAIRAGDTKYTSIQGNLALRQAVADKFKRENNLTYTPDQIIVGSARNP